MGTLSGGATLPFSVLLPFSYISGGQLLKERIFPLGWVCLGRVWSIPRKQTGSYNCKRAENIAV